MLSPLMTRYAHKRFFAFHCNINVSTTKQTDREGTHCDDYRGAAHNLACLTLLVNLAELQHNFKFSIGAASMMIF